MRARDLPLSLALAAGLGACGGAAPAPELSLGFSSAALEASVAAVRIVFHPANRSCANLALSPMAPGVYQRDLVLDAARRADGGTESFAELRAGLYTVSGAGGPSLTESATAFGCVEGITIEDGVQAEIALTLAPL